MSMRPMSQAPGPYIPSRDVADRHEYGVTKNRKVSSTGGGRAWSEEEEAYLLQTRLQKMPYKYIAAHLKKTELACRLHYHQLSHGNNRRKRAASCSSGTSNDNATPLPTGPQSPICESESCSASPPVSSRGYSPPTPNAAGGIQLPSIVTTEEAARLPAILPKPQAMAIPAPPPQAPTQSYGSPAAEPHSHVSPPLFHRGVVQRTTPPLRLDCTSLPPSTMHPASAPVDHSRLNAIYSAHRASFWTTIASEYGANVSPTALEQAWKHGPWGSQSVVTPITPISSPGNVERDVQRKGHDKTRISSILGIDADPRTARDRDMVRRLEEERFGVMQAAA